LEAIRKHTWPGNVRELENKLQRAWLFHIGNVVSAADLGFEISPQGSRPLAEIEGDGETFENKTLEQYREGYESSLLRTCLKHFKGNITKCAEHLQISRNTCKSMLRKYRLLQEDEEEG
jgi:two-component system NtrC family response regulator